jgi:mono/diheme cytochrome c family protein
MPKFRLSDGDVKALVVFLKSRRGKNFAETEIDRYRTRLSEAAEPPATAAEPRGSAGGMRGEKLILDRACLACHKLGDRDGGVAPDLSWQGLLKSEEWIYAHFKNPRAVVSDSIMPSFRFSDDEFRAMTSYLAGLKSPPPGMSPADTYKTLCQRCHGEKGDGHGLIAVYLDPYPRDLTKAGFMNSKPYERLLDSVEQGVPGTSMPAWGKVLNEGQARGVLDYVLATFTKAKRRELKPRNAPDTNPVAMGEDSVRRGEETFVRRCAGCHGKKADGKGPNSLDILPRPRNLRNTAFVESVSDRRLFEAILYGVQGTAMPPWIDYGLSTNEVGDLVNFIRSVNWKGKGSSNARAD